MKTTIIIPVFYLLTIQCSAQPYLDIVYLKFTNSPYQGFWSKNNGTLSYLNTGLTVPVGFKAIHGLVVFSPFYEQWNTRVRGYSGTLTVHQNFVFPVSFVDTVSSHRWRYAISPIIRMKNLSLDGAGPVQWGVAGLAIFSQNPSLTWKFGGYFNRDYFGNFFMPLFGIDWWIDNKNKLFGVLPGNLIFEHKTSDHFYYGVAFKAITNSYLDIDRKYFRAEDNQLGVFADLYLSRHIVLNTELGYSMFREMTIGGKNIPLDNLGIHDAIYVKSTLAYRLRF